MSKFRQFLSSHKRTLLVTLLAALLAGGGIGLAAYLLVDRLDPDDVVINPDVVVYDNDTSPFKIIASDAQSVTVSSLDGIDVGATILAAGATDKTPDGLLRRVTKSSETERGYRLETKPAALTEAIEQCSVEATIELMSDGSQIVTYKSDDDGTSSGPMLIQSAWASNDAPLIRHEENGLKTEADVDLDVKLNMDHGSIHMETIARFRASAGISFENGKDISFDKELFRKSYPVTMMVGSLPVVLNSSLAVQANASAALEHIDFGTEVELARKVGFVYDTKTGLKPVNEDDSSVTTPAFEAGVDICSAEAGAGVSLSFETLLYGMAGPKFSVGPEVHVDGRFMVSDADTAFKLPGSDLRFEGKASAGIGIPIKGIFTVSFPDFNPFDTNGPEEVANVELFDAGDLLTLYDESWSAGEMPAEPIWYSGGAVDPEYGTHSSPYPYILSVSFEGDTMVVDGALMSAPSEQKLKELNPYDDPDIVDERQTYRFKLTDKTVITKLTSSEHGTTEHLTKDEFKALEHPYAPLTIYEVDADNNLLSIYMGV